MESRRLWVARSEAILYTLLNLEQKHPLRGAKVQIDSGHMKIDGPGHKGTAVQKEETPRAAVEGFREEGTGPWEAGRDSGSSTGTGVMLRSHQTGSAGEKRFIRGVGVGGVDPGGHQKPCLAWDPKPGICTGVGSRREGRI